MKEYERSLKMTEIDFISSLGGVFGLFLGFSLMSFVEIIYWFCVVLVRRAIWGKWLDNFDLSHIFWGLIKNLYLWNEHLFQPSKNHRHSTYDWVAAWGHFPCTRPHQTCHLWKLALGLCDVQLGWDFNMWETLTQRVNCPKELAIYGPGLDLWPLNFGP